MSERVKSVFYPLLLLIVVLLFWQYAVVWFKVPDYIVPPLSGVLKALYHGYIEGAYLGDFTFTLMSMAIGYMTGCLLAFILGCLFAEFRSVERLLHPFVLALQSMPKVALAPLILVWFGFDMASKVVMVALVCFFPMFINTAMGLKSTDASLIDLMRAFSASRWHILTRIKIPCAGTHIFAGLQISVVLGLIGAVVAEFVSSTKGLGYVINSATTSLDTSVMFAALISLALLGICTSQLIRFLHKRIIFWENETDQRTIQE